MIAALVLIPFIVAALSLFFSRRAVVTIAAAAINIALCIALAGKVLREGAVSYAFRGFAARLELVFFADGLVVILLMTTALIGLLVALYAVAYLRPDNERKIPAVIRHRFWLLWLILIGGINGVLLSGNIFAIYFFLEVIGATAVSMVALAGNRRAQAASMRYFLARMPGSMAFLLGVVLLYSAYGTLDLRQLAQMLEPTGLVSAAAALMMLGVVAKASLFPLHFWLPVAHSAAIGPASAMLSGVVVKAPFYVALRLWFDLFPDIATAAAAQFIGMLGAAGIIWGGAQALRSNRLKQIVAHSTVSQMGFLFLLFPLLTGAPGTEWVNAAWTGGMYQLMSHALAKAALLMAAGAVLYSLGSDKIPEMHGIARQLPVTTLVIALSCVTLIGLPPSGGFIAKWLLLTVAIQSGQWWWIIPLIGGGLLTAGYAFRMLSYAFRFRREESPVRRVPRLLTMTALTLALIAILMGLRVQEPLLLIVPIADYAGIQEVAP